MVPAVGSISRRIARPTVDLPQPDSPTRPSVSPSAIEKLTPSTANTWPPARRRNPWLITKCCLRSRTSNTGGELARTASAIAAPENLLRPPTGGPVRRPLLLVSRVAGAASVLGEGAARREHA